jgi:nitrogen regulatory protein P-II 1
VANLLVLVLDQLEKFPDVLKAWEEAGVPGVTILDSVGSRRLQGYSRLDDLPLMPSLRSLAVGEEIHNRTLLAVIEDDAVLERAIAAAEKVVGDFAQPDTGILFVMPVSRAWGVQTRGRVRKIE